MNNDPQVYHAEDDDTYMHAMLKGGGFIADDNPRTDE
jgi:hypothetical protein